jgi:ethanolamine utilization microcompartment shell protein EutL
MIKSKPRKRRRGAGRPSKPDAERLVLLAGKVPPEIRAGIEQIAAAKDWTVSTAVRVACRLLILQESTEKSAAVNENLLTS